MEPHRVWPPPERGALAEPSRACRTRISEHAQRLKKRAGRSLLRFASWTECSIATIMAASTEGSADRRSYTGNCHCGAVKFTIRVPEIREAEICNCSICAIKGLMYITPEKGMLDIERGEDALTAYTFGTGKYIHKVSDNSFSFIFDGAIRVLFQ